MGSRSCCIPDCKFLERQKMRKKGNLNIPKDRLFAVKRPDLAKSEMQRKHRQNITNIVLSIRDAAMGDTIKDMLHKESASICECHFPPEDFYFEKSRKVLRLGAIPILEMPKIPYQMKNKELKNKKRKQMEVAKNNSAKTQTPVRSRNDVETVELLVEDEEDVNSITLSTTSSNNFSRGSALISLKQRMWNFINQLIEYCTSLSQAIPVEKRLTNTFKLITDEFAEIKYMYLRDELQVAFENFEEQTETEDNIFSLINKASVIDMNLEIGETEDNLSTGGKSDYCSTVTLPDNQNGLSKIKINTDLYSCQTSTIANQNVGTMNIAEICSIESMLKPQVPRVHNTLYWDRKQKKLLTLAHLKTKTSSNIPHQKMTNTTAKDQASKESRSSSKQHYLKFKINHEKFGECYKCAVCNKIFKKWNLLRHHDKVHINSYKVQCKICERNIAAYNIKAHTRNHNNKRTHSCDLCGADFFLPRHLKTHLVQVTACTFPSFQCKICEEKFRKEKEYGNHFKEKHLKKNIICDLCGDEVCEKCVDDKHQVTLLKLYKCKFCEESFTFKQEYKSHLRENHSSLHPSPALLRIRGYDKKKEKFLCEFCPKTFTNAKSLEGHRIKKHKIQE